MSLPGWNRKGRRFCKTFGGLLIIGVTILIADYCTMVQLRFWIQGLGLWGEGFTNNKSELAVIRLVSQTNGLGLIRRFPPRWMRSNWGCLWSGIDVYLSCGISSFFGLTFFCPLIHWPCCCRDPLNAVEAIQRCVPQFSDGRAHWKCLVSFSVI